MNERYFKVKIPWATKAYIRNKTNGLRANGFAYFVYDKKENKFINEYIELIKSNYRITDIRMKKTKYFEKPIVKKFRNDILDKFSLNQNNTNESKYQNLNKEQIVKINREFKKLNTTIKTMYSLIAGSNISGAETNSKSSPMRYNGVTYFDCNFANVFDKFFDGKKQKYLEIRNDIKTYSLKEIIELNLIPKFNETFYKYNKDYNEKIKVSIKKEETKDNELKATTKFEFNENQNLFIDSWIKKTLYNDNNSKSDKENLKKKLRSYYDLNVKKCLEDKIIPFWSTNFKYDSDIVQNAHIFSFSELINQNTKQSLKDAISPFNCLRINSDMHLLWDKHKIFFDIEGNACYKNNEIYKKNYLNLESMNEETRKYYSKYLRLLKNNDY